jgi:hypothetical protein
MVGGLGRLEPRYAQMAAAAGHEALFHDGDTRGRGASALVHMITRADLVVLVTDVNSHGALRDTRRVLRELGRSPVLMRRCGVAKFASVLSALDSLRRVGGDDLGGRTWA